MARARPGICATLASQAAMVALVVAEPGPCPQSGPGVGGGLVHPPQRACGSECVLGPGGFSMGIPGLRLRASR